MAKKPDLKDLKMSVVNLSPLQRVIELLSQ